MNLFYKCLIAFLIGATAPQWISQVLATDECATQCEGIDWYRVGTCKNVCEINNHLSKED